MKDPAKFGCHYAVVEIDVPKNLSEDAKQKLAEKSTGQLLPVVPAVLQGQAVPVRRTVRAALAGNSGHGMAGRRKTMQAIRIKQQNMSQAGS